MAKEVRVKMRSVSASDFPPGGAARGGRSQRQRVTAEEEDQEDQEMLDDDGNSSITLVDLQSNSLSALPPHVLLLGTSLRTLIVNWNQLRTLPDTISSLENLCTLDVSFNRISALPSTIGTLATSLTCLRVSDNDLEDLPMSTGQLTGLTELGLHYNRLRKIPDAVLMLSQLCTLNVSGNPIDQAPPPQSPPPDTTVAGLYPSSPDPLDGLTQNHVAVTTPAGVGWVFVYPSTPDPLDGLTQNHVGHRREGALGRTRRRSNVLALYSGGASSSSQPGGGGDAGASDVEDDEEEATRVIRGRRGEGAHRYVSAGRIASQRTFGGDAVRAQRTFLRGSDGGTRLAGSGLWGGREGSEGGRVLRLMGGEGGGGRPRLWETEGRGRSAMREPMVEEAANVASLLSGSTSWRGRLRNMNLIRDLVIGPRSSAAGGGGGSSSTPAEGVQHRPPPSGGSWRRWTSSGGTPEEDTLTVREMLRQRRRALLDPFDSLIASVAGDTALPSEERYPSEEARSSRDSFAGDDFSCDTDSRGEEEGEGEEEEGEVEGMPKNLICPITHQTFRDPVVASDGFSYERRAIERWLRRSDRSPMTGQTLLHKATTPNHTLRSMVCELSPTPSPKKP